MLVLARTGTVMGAGASLPDEVDEPTAKELAGDKYDATAFAAAATDGKISKAAAAEWASANMAGAEAGAEAGEAKEDGGGGVKLKEARAHFHGPFQVGGKPKPDELTKCDELAAAFAAALASHGQNEDLIGLFAAEGASWSDPAPKEPYVGTEALKARIEKLPPMDKVEVKEVFYSMSPKIFLAKTEMTFTGKAPFIILDSFELNDENKIVKLESHFHGPYQVGGAPKPEALTKCDAIAEQFGQALFTHGQNEDLINIFAEDGSWTDPVPTPAHAGTDALKARIEKLPPMDKVEVQEVFYSMSPKIFHAKTEVTFTGKKPFVILDKFVCV